MDPDLGVEQISVVVLHDGLVLLLSDANDQRNRRLKHVNQSNRQNWNAAKTPFEWTDELVEAEDERGGLVFWADEHKCLFKEYGFNDVDKVTGIQQLKDAVVKWCISREDDFLA